MSGYVISITLTAALLLAIPPSSAATTEYDLVVYGGTSAAVTAAVQARRMDKSVVVVSPDAILGGLSSGGLGWTDTGDKSVIGGLSREFYHHVWKYYQSDDAWRWQTREEYGNQGQGTPAMDGEFRTMWIFEPHVAEQVFEDFLRDYDIPVYRNEWLDREECANLLVPVCVFCSHIAFGSIRMEPVFMILGQSATTAAVMALDADIAPEELDYDLLAARLRADGQVLEWQRDGCNHVEPDKLPGIVMDNPAAEAVGPWKTSRSVFPMVGLNYAHDNKDTDEHCVMRYAVALPAPGRYELRISYSAHPNRAANAPVTLYHANDKDTFFVNQRKTPPIDDLFLSLGVFTFDDQALVVLSNENTDGYVTADAVQFLPMAQ